ncbi:MAG TPA: hypothetical protein VFF43_22560, partial [Caldimonas sp.]|nr:hypothetical protein [Caldimonas sp.]
MADVAERNGQHETHATVDDFFVAGDAAHDGIRFHSAGEDRKADAPHDVEHAHVIGRRPIAARARHETRCTDPDRHRFAMRHPIPGRRLERMPDRVAEVEHGTPPRLTRIRRDDLSLDARGLGDDVTPPRRLRVGGHRRDALEQVRVRDDRALDSLGKAGPPLAIGQRFERAEVCHDRARIPE